jgi:hypothetical protein
MERTVALLLTVVVVFGTAVALPVAGATVDVREASTPGDGPASALAVTAQNGTIQSGNLTPGERLAGVLGVQNTEIRAEMSARTFAVRMQQARSNETKAALVAQELNQTRERLGELRQEREQLREAYENGNISRGTYQARTARLAAEKVAIERSISQTANAAERVPEEALQRKGANPQSVRDLQRSAADLGGPDVSEAAKSVVGDGVGNGFGHATPGNGSAKGASENAGGAPGAGGQQSGAPGQSENASNASASNASAPGEKGNSSGSDNPGKSGENPGQSGDTQGKSGTGQDKGGDSSGKNAGNPGQGGAARDTDPTNGTTSNATTVTDTGETATPTPNETATPTPNETATPTPTRASTETATTTETVATATSGSETVTATTTETVTPAETASTGVNGSS